MGVNLFGLGWLVVTMVVAKFSKLILSFYTLFNGGRVGKYDKTKGYLDFVCKPRVFSKHFFTIKSRGFFSAFLD